MRSMFAKTCFEIQESDVNSVILLGDIGVHAFRASFEKFPDRTYNIGILEQSMVGIASGLAIQGFNPILHTIAPFLVERALEQIKIDFAYQKLSATLVSVGGSFDYAALGATHHCPADVNLIGSIPGTQIYVPGTAQELQRQLLEVQAIQGVKYIRMSEKMNSLDYLQGGKSFSKIQEGNTATILVIGPLVDDCLEQLSNMDIEIIYFNNLNNETLIQVRNLTTTRKVILVAPFYGAYLHSLMNSLFEHSNIVVSDCSVPLDIHHTYGNLKEHLMQAGVAGETLKHRILKKIANQLT